VVRWARRPEALRGPALVAAFRGWNDAGEAASIALATLVRGLGAELAATLDGEEFYDYQTTRPAISIVSGRLRGIEWPDVEVWVARPEGAVRDLVLVGGAEPSLRWRAFCSVLLDLARDLDAALLLTMGALLADVPHTRPVRVGGMAAPPELIAGLGLRGPTYEGPTGIVGVLHAAAAQRSLPAASIWASVPHYLGTLRSPPCALALVRVAEAITQVAVDASELERASADYERQVDAVVERDRALREVVAGLERRADSAEEPQAPETLPSGEALAQEIERYLRQRGEPGA